MNQLGVRIKKLRLVKGFTQEEVASKLYLSIKAYQNIEHGITKLDLERIEQLANIFEITVDDLIKNPELKIKFEEMKIKKNNQTEIHDDINYSTDLEAYNLLLKEKDNEIAFLRELLKKYLQKITNC